LADIANKLQSTLKIFSTELHLDLRLAVDKVS